MGNNLDAYRAAIRLFHACKMSLNIGYDSRSDTFHDILITNLRCSFLFASLLILQSLNPKVNVAFILFVLHFFIIGWQYWIQSCLYIEYTVECGRYFVW